VPSDQVSPGRSSNVQRSPSALARQRAAQPGTIAPSGPKAVSPVKRSLRIAKSLTEP
jgi:hypothetical protein